MGDEWPWAEIKHRTMLLKVEATMVQVRNYLEQVERLWLLSYNSGQTFTTEDDWEEHRLQMRRLSKKKRDYTAQLEELDEERRRLQVSLR